MIRSVHRESIRLRKIVYATIVTFRFLLKASKEIFTQPK